MLNRRCVGHRSECCLVLVRGDRPVRRSVYSGTAGLRLSARRLGTAAAVIVALTCGGCSYQLDSMLSKPDADVDQTGSIVAARAPAAAGRRAIEPVWSTLPMPAPPLPM